MWHEGNHYVPPDKVKKRARREGTQEEGKSRGTSLYNCEGKL